MARASEGKQELLSGFRHILQTLGISEKGMIIIKNDDYALSMVSEHAK